MQTIERQGTRRVKAQRPEMVHERKLLICRLQMEGS
jgi:hypothetical protein